MISTEADARVDSVEVYRQEDIPVEELKWAITENIVRAYEGDFYLPMSEEERYYWEERKDDWFPSTRSTLARNSLDFWIKEPEMLDGGLRGGFEAQCFQNRVNIDEGDDVFRILMYEEGDRLDRCETEDKAEEILQNQFDKNQTSPEGFLKVPIQRRLTLQEYEATLEELEGDKDRFVSYGEASPESSYFQLMESAPVEMPENIFGRIWGTSMDGSYHLNSVAIDPGYEGEIVLEVVRALPWTDDFYEEGNEFVEMELYTATEIR